MPFFYYASMAPTEEEWGRPFTIKRYAGVFSAKFPSTLQQIQREVRKLGGDQATIALAIDEKWIRVDGAGILADGRPMHPGVRLLFPSTHGELRYQCDYFTGWQQNLREIGMTLERLRLVGNRGVLATGEQYVGSRKQLGYTPMHSMTKEQAAQFVAGIVGDGPTWATLLRDAGAWKMSYQNAARQTHPDMSQGREADWTKLQEARELIDAVHHRGR